MAHQIVVAPPDEVVPKTVHSSDRGWGMTSTPLGQKYQPSHGKMSTTDFHQFIYEMLLQRKMPKTQAAHISKNAWREGTVKDKKTILKHWIDFTKQNGFKRHDFKFNNLMKFMEFVRICQFSYCEKSKDIRVCFT